MVFRRFYKRGGIGVFCIAAVAIIFCNRDYNPFIDPTNANVYVNSWTFMDRDSVALFETGTFKLVVAVREEVDSFVFSTPNNRYWTDTVVKRTSPAGGLNSGPYSLNVSFFDTGKQVLTLTVFRSNGEILSRKFEVPVVYNPLRQGNVTGFFSDTIVLSTMPVPDREVVYHWSLDSNWNGSSVYTPWLSAAIPLFSQRYGNGSLWVSDLSGKHESPRVAFTYSLNDTSKPVIQCLNGGMEGKTIVSGDTVFAFKVLISDAGGAEVESCSVNGAEFDFVNRSSHVYTRLLSDLPGSTAGNAGLALTVFALDNRLFSNSAVDTFFVVFDPSGIKSYNVAVTFDQPNSAMTTTSQRGYRIHGTAQNDHGDSMQISCRINGNVDSIKYTIAGAGEWSWLVSLDTSVTVVTVSANGVNGRLLASAQCTIVFDPNAADTVKPMIWEVSADGQLLGSRFYTDRSALMLRVVAFDDGSGLAHLSINSDTLPVDSSSYIWFRSIGQLEHSPQGNPVRVVAIDNRNNRQERTFVIYRNSLPYLAGEIGLPGECCAESTYNARFSWWDDDMDDVALDSIKVPDGMIVSKVGDKEGTISWKPVLRPDTDRDTLILELSDRYEKSRLQWIFTCKRCSRSAVSLAFTTTEQDFPGVLQAGFDRLNVRLSIDSSGVAFRPRYSAKLIDDNTGLLDNDTSGIVRWAPSIADTGYRKIRVTVGDGVHNFDTLYPAVWVVPKNLHTCSLSVVFSGATTAAGALDLFSHPAPETLFFAIHDRDHPLTEIYTSTVTMGSLRSVEVLDQKEFFVVIEPDSSRFADTLGVMVRDRTGGDSVQFIIQYAVPSANIPPQLSGDPEFPVYFCADSSYEFLIETFDLNGDNVEVMTLFRPEGMTVSSLGLVKWTPMMSALGDDSLVIMLSDGQDSSYVKPWVLTALDCDNMPPAVRFKTAVGDFPTLLQAEVDSITIQLETVAGTGVPPFVYRARMDNGTTILNDATGRLIWNPTALDSGARTMTVSVTDRYNTADTISPQFTVVPRNCHLCSLSYVYSGTTLPSGQLYLHSTEQPESALFVISDADDPRMERYLVTVDRPFPQPTTQRLGGAERSFSVKINHTYFSSDTIDTIVVAVNDSTGYADTVRLVVRYPLGDPDNIADCSFALSAAADVTTSFPGNTVSAWTDGTSSRWPPWYGSGAVSLSQSDTDRRPTLAQKAVNGKPAILFDGVTDNGDDGLFDESYQQWADTPFTMFIVFSARSLPSNDRTALVTTNTINGFALGIACGQTIGIFNDVTRKCCNSKNECQGSDLSVSLNTWYVATYQSSLGITVGGAIRVQAWLDGKPASQAMEITTQSNAGMAVGTGSSATYNGSLDGWIASVVLFQRELSPDERSLVERYLGSQYTITIK